MKDFKGKIALVTGGTSGIGTAVAKAFAKEGAKVMLAGRRDELGNDVVESIEKDGGQAAFIKTDVRKPADIGRMVDETVSVYGRLDIAINNAGVEQKFTPLNEQTLDDFDYVMETNVRGVWLSIKHEVEAMRKTGGGSIVNVSSIAGVVAMPQIPIYVASKHAVIGLTKSLALEFAQQGIRINVVLPAVIATPMIDRFAKDEAKVEYLNSLHPVGRIGKPDEVADAVLWLASEHASFVTGTSLRVDGGYTAQ